MSEQHTSISHRIAHVCGQRGSVPNLVAFSAPGGAFDSVLEAVTEVLRGEQDALRGFDVATVETSGVNRALAIDLVHILPMQRMLTRAALLLHASVVNCGADTCRLEHWARKDERRFRTVLSPLVEDRSQPPAGDNTGGTVSKWSY